MCEKTRYWDTLILSVSTDSELVAKVRMMYDRSELEPGFNIPRGRSFDRDRIDLPEIVVAGSTSSGLSCRAYYSGEEGVSPGLEIELDLNVNPEMWIQIGTEEEPAYLGLEIIDMDDPIDSDEYDDDGRYDAWV